MKLSENAIESVYRQHFADSGVVIRDYRAGIPGTIEVAHASVRPADEGCVAEDDPRLLRPGKKPSPEKVKSHRQTRAIAGQPGFGGPARQKSVRGDSHSGGEEDRQRDYGNQPFAGRLAVTRQS